jgi:hypothetical protein
MVPLMATPELRSSLVKEQLASIDALGPEPARRVREAAARAIIAIERSSRMEWLPIEALLDVLDATLTVLGPEAAEAHWHRSTLRSFEIPLVKPFVAGALSLFNPSPERVMPLLPKLLSLLYRDIGTTTVEVIEPGLVQVVHAELPSVMLGSRAWSASMAASYRATLDFLRAVDGRVETTMDAGAARCAFTLRCQSG